MSLRKQKNEINRTRMRLGSWLDRHPDGPLHYSQMLHPMLEQIARALNIPVPDVGEALGAPPLSIQMSSFMYEECVLRPWIKADQRPIDDFIAKQVRRERPFGRKFIASLATSKMRVWKVVDVHRGKWIAVLPLRDTPDAADKVRHVYDLLASESLVAGDYLLARVISMPEGRVFSASLLPLSKAQAGSLLSSSADSIVHNGFVTWGIGALHMLSDSTTFGSGFASSSTLHTGSASEQFAAADTKGTHQNGVPGERRTGEHAQSRESDHTDHTEHTEHADDTRRSDRQADDQHDTSGAQSTPGAASTQPPDRKKLLDRIRKLFAMSQETEASPHEAEIALRRCQSLMSRYGISESDLHTSQFSTETFRRSHRVPMHIRWLAGAMQSLHSVLFVTGGGEGPEFRGFDIDVKVARLTMEYLEDAIERSLATRRRAGTFPAGRSAAYDYRVSFAIEVYERIETLVDERKAAEAAATVTGTSLTIRKMEIVDQQCGQDLRSSRDRYFGARPGEAADAGRTDGARVSLDPQVDVSGTVLIEN